MRPVSLQLEGAIRPAANASCIGVALFRRGRGNLRYVGECDRFLHIARFVEFDEFDAYELDYELPLFWKGQTFQIGDALPVPYWQRDHMQIVAGDTAPSEFLAEERKSVLRTRVAGILQQAQEGRLVGPGVAVEEDLFKTSFQDILEEEPTYSHYWVARYDMAARQLKNAPWQLRNQLRERKLLWLERYARKADLGKIGRLISAGAGAKLSPDDTDLIYAVVVDRLFKMKHGHIAWATQSPIFLANFPDGVAGHYERRGWPRQRYKLQVPEQFHSPMLTAIDEAEEFENNENEWARAEVVAFVMYGQNPLPYAFEELMRQIIQDREEDLYGRLNAIWPLSHYHAEAQKVPVEIMNRYHAYLRMQRILRGGDRLDSFPKSIDLTDIAKKVNYNWKVR